MRYVDTMNKSGRSKLTAEQSADAARAKAQFVKWKRRTGGTQMQVATREFSGDANYVWQLLNGWRPLNEDAVHSFAKVFGCTMGDISPEWGRRFNSKVASTKIRNRGRQSSSSVEPEPWQYPLAKIRGIAPMNDAGSWQQTDMLPAEGSLAWNRPGRYALRITGDSLHPRYKSGEYIVLREDAAIEPDCDVLLLLKDGTMMIREFASLREGLISLRAIGNGGRRTVRQDQVQFMHQIVGRADHSEVAPI